MLLWGAGIAPEVLGVDEVSHAGVLIRTWIKTQPLQQWAVGREFRLRLKNAFDKHDIQIGVPQQQIWYIPNTKITPMPEKMITHSSQFKDEK